MNHSAIGWVSFSHLSSLPLRPDAESECPLLSLPEGGCPVLFHPVLLRLRVGVLFALFFFLLCLSGCASAPEPRAALTREVVVDLPTPCRATPLRLQQLLTVQMPTVDGEPTKRQSLLVALEADGQKVSLVGFSLLGVRLFRIDYDAHGIRSEQLPPLAALGALPPPAQVLADVMLSYWPQAVWQAKLPAGWLLIDTPMLRQLRDGQGQLVSEIQYREGSMPTAGAEREPVMLWQHAFGYRLSIQTLPEAAPSGGQEVTP